MALRPSQPMSNVERQRQFRERNPGYRNRYRAVEAFPERAIIAAQAAAAAADVGAARAVASPVCEDAEVWYAGA